MTDYVKIEVQNEDGSWVSVSQVRNEPGTIRDAMRFAQSNAGGRRVRAVDMSGRLIDIL